ncbi:MAG: helix-turn-helix domain-containing protein [Anaerolineae bacterium]|nr:helix-turn-helix domain-containing protein [Anaerolineae bacterium]MCA9892046.1 helix-turn-helix domain-containing protein [Anaerolineae bacterium]
MRFKVSISTSTVSNLKHPDKHKLRATMIRLRQQGKSYRQIGNSLGIHWTRVSQILKT